MADPRVPPLTEASWGLVATVKAPLDKVLAFAAHHLHLGASRLWLCFDDPADPAANGLPDHPALVPIRCDDAHWLRLGGRPDRHQNRQSKNAKAVYRGCRLDWLGHLDVDEFLWPARPVGQVLAGVPQAQIMVRTEPFEAMSDPALPDDIFTARQFRGALKPRHAALRGPVLGTHADVLPDGMLSHSAGKVFFRSGVDGLSPRLHGAFLAGQRLPGPAFARDLPLLHFHAQNSKDWLAALPFRLTRGAYQYNPALQAHLEKADAAGRMAFHSATQSLTAEQASALHTAGRLIEADLDLRTRVALLTGSGRQKPDPAKPED